MPKLPLTYGRQAFGNDPVSYSLARPDYPDALYQRLTDRCGKLSGASVFEIGAGTGLATRRLLALGISSLLAIEPDPNLSDFLRREISDDALYIDQNLFEDAVLTSFGFDLGIAATSFHWLEQSSALAKVYKTLKPGGWWAMWWTQFGSDKEYDAFQAATDHLFIKTPDSPSHGNKKGYPFALDQEERLKDLISAGFQNAEVDIWKWTLTYDTARLVKLYRTFSPIQALAPEQREQFFQQLAIIANEKFCGYVERPCITILYTAQTSNNMAT